MSVYLKFGNIHPRTMLADLARKRSHGAEQYRRQVAWRDFYADILFQRPDSARRNYDAKFDAMRHDTGRDADALFAAWCEGRTGFPIVDAGMRQLVSEGWMHNRVRMIVASFLVKDLHLPWWRGARFFMQHLVDGDLASNQHGWQWTAGRVPTPRRTSGCSTRPGRVRSSTPREITCGVGCRNCAGCAARRCTP